jgi:predicted ribosomally synthesized peptide with SipW-like signal peptide
MKRLNNKKTFLSSIIALILCLSTFVGTTYAWFTDTASSSANIISAGSLDAVLQYKSNWSDDWSTVDENTKIFNEDARYEPGYTEIVYLRVSNAGTLGFKYMLSLNLANEESSINVYGEEFKLSDYLKIGTYVQDEYVYGFNYADILMPVMFADRETSLHTVELATLASAEAKICNDSAILPGDQTSQVIAIVLTMPEEVGNEANARPGEQAPYIELGVRLFASQLVYEEDSFGPDYDSNVDAPTVHEIYNNDDLYRAFEEGGIAKIYNMNLTEVSAQLADDKQLAINTNNSTISGNDNDYVIVNYGNLEITGDGTIVNNMKGSIENWGKLYINNLNIEVKGIKYGFHCKSGTVEINDLVLNAERGGVNVQGGTVVINSADVEFSGYYDNANKKWSTGYLVYAGGNTSKVIINGGDYNFTGTNGKQRVICAEYGAVVEVYGGKFSKGGKNVSSTWFWEREGGDIIVYGGTFEFDPTEWLADGYQAIKGADGWWTVSKIA